MENKEDIEFHGRDPETDEAEKAFSEQSRKEP